MIILKYKTILIQFQNDIDKLKDTFKENNIDFELFVDEVKHNLNGNN